MSELVIFNIFLVIMGICAVIDVIVTFFDRLYAKRRYQRVHFLAKHPKYAENPDGTLVKIR